MKEYVWIVRNENYADELTAHSILGFRLVKVLENGSLMSRRIEEE